MKFLCSIPLLLIFSYLPVFSETVVVAPTGVYKEIDTSADNLLIQRLNSENTAVSKNAFDSVMTSLDSHNPIVLCVAGRYQFLGGAPFQGIKLYLIGRLRVIYDTRRCTDPTVGDTVQVLDQQLFPTFQEWVNSNKAEYIKANLEAISYFASHHENYDQRWINLRGMGAIQEGMGGEPKNNPLSLPEFDWARIKTELVTRQMDFFQNYEENYFIGRFGRSSAMTFNDPLVLRLARASAKGDKAELLSLVSAGTDPNFKGKNGVTPLVWAIGSGNTVGVETLLLNGANPNVIFEKSISAIGLSVFLGQGDILELLLKHGGQLVNVEGIDPDQLMQDAVLYSQPGSLKVIQILHKHGVSVLGRTGFEGKYLETAISFGAYEKALLLIGLGADKVISNKNREFIQKEIKKKLGQPSQDKNFPLLLQKLKDLGFETSP